LIQGKLNNIFESISAPKFQHIDSEQKIRHKQNMKRRNQELTRTIEMNEEYLSQHGPSTSGSEYHLMRLLRRGIRRKASLIGVSLIETRGR